MNRPRRKGWWVPAGIILAVLALLLILYPEAKKRWMTPLEPESGLPSVTPGLPTATDSTPASSPTARGSDRTAEAGNVPQTPALEASTANVNAAETPQPVCGGPPIMTILAV
ncbi:MAG TPA: hypothetical protein VE136_18655, partial [Anaerolineales bacterium]|nr:hypothetical protein [Anaerolineales bacterium]